MKAWKTMMRRIKEVQAHLAEEIKWAGKDLVGLSIYGRFVSVKQGKSRQTKELGPLPLSLTWGCQQLKRPGLPLCS
jgi:hypothetical protein